MKKTLLSAILMAAVSFYGIAQTFDNIPTGEGYYINKIIASPSGSDQTKELIEIRGEANAVIPSDLWLAVIEGDGNSSNVGRVTEEIQLGDGTRTFGANGIFVLVSNYTDDNTAVVTTNAYDGLVNADASILEIEVTGTDVTSSSSSAVTGFTPDIGFDGNLSDQTGTYMLIQGADPDGVRIDGDGDMIAADGEIDDTGDHTSWILYDSITYMDDNDEGAGEFGYGQIVIAQNQTAAGDNQFITPSAVVYNFSDPVDGSDSDVNIMIRQGLRTGYTTDDWAFAASSNNDDFPNWSFSTTTNKVFPVEANGWDGINTVYGDINPEFTNLSVDGFELADFSVYPNPSSDVVFVRTNATLETVALYDTLGKKVYESTDTTSINVASFAKGIYFLTVNSANGTATKKLVIQ